MALETGSHNMKANDIQVGGNHYKNGDYEHWDWATNVGLDYLASAASKYVTRWRSKNGIEDLSKAGHYIAKLIEVSPIILLRLQHTRPPVSYIDAETTRFVRANQLGSDEAKVCRLLAVWETRGQLHQAQGYVNGLIIQAQQEVPPPQRSAIYTPFDPEAAKPVPLEDSNKHAERE